METKKDESYTGGGQPDIFIETIPKYGNVSMLFYIPDTVKDKDEIVQLIRENGGNTVKFHECFTYQLGPPEGVVEQNYYPGVIYSTDWIKDSIK